MIEMVGPDAVTYSTVASWGISRFNDERNRQLQIGYSKAGDRNRADELARAGACYADFAAGQIEEAEQDEPHPFWPWNDNYWKPGDTPLRTLEKAGALLAAAYDELKRQEDA